MRRLIYVGAHPRVSLPWGGFADREGDPVEAEDQLAEELIARGDFLEYKPEPVTNPVQTIKEK